MAVVTWQGHPWICIKGEEIYLFLFIYFIFFKNYLPVKCPENGNLFRNSRLVLLLFLFFFFFFLDLATFCSFGASGAFSQFYVKAVKQKKYPYFFLFLSFISLGKDFDAWFHERAPRMWLYSFMFLLWKRRQRVQMT